MLDRQIIHCHFARHIYKHILAWPIQFMDFESLDEEKFREFKRLQGLTESGEDLSTLCLTFTTTIQIIGETRDVERVESGSHMEVTNDNFPDYIDCCQSQVQAN